MNLSVLIAEDDALVRRTIPEALQVAGHRVEAVADGQLAISRCWEQSVYREVRSIPSCATTPFRSTCG